MTCVRGFVHCSNALIMQAGGPRTLRLEGGDGLGSCVYHGIARHYYMWNVCIIVCVVMCSCTAPAHHPGCHSAPAPALQDAARLHTCTHVHGCTHGCTHCHMHAQTHVHMYMRTRARAHTRTHTHTHTRTHTHTHTPHPVSLRASSLRKGWSGDFHSGRAPTCTRGHILSFIS